MHYGGMQYTHLTLLASILATHLGRSDMTVAKRCGVHSRLFLRLKAGGGCRVDTFNAALAAFSSNWPPDLEWPADVPRPKPAKKERAA